MQFRQKPREDLELNLIPLIDVIFMLLIFFMLTTTFVHDRTLNVTLPVSRWAYRHRWQNPRCG
jgi:biopolymer transport protein ExbD